jgi:hypothetical protein
MRRVALDANQFDLCGKFLGASPDARRPGAASVNRFADPAPAHAHQPRQRPGFRIERVMHDQQTRLVAAVRTYPQYRESSGSSRLSPGLSRDRRAAMRPRWSREGRRWSSVWAIVDAAARSSLPGLDTCLCARCASAMRVF